MAQNLTIPAHGATAPAVQSETVSASWLRRRNALLRHCGLILFGIFMLYPLIWMAVSAFKPSHLVLTDPGIIPTEVTLDNFRTGWRVGGYTFLVFFGNSLVVAIS